MEDPQFFIGQKEKEFESHRHTRSSTYRKHWLRQVCIYSCCTLCFQSVWRVFFCRKVMTRRAFKHFSSIMPRFNFNISVLFCTGLLIFTVRADFKGQPDLKRTQVTVNLDLINKEAELAPILCDCEFFVQSWKTSHMIRLPMGIQPVRANSSTTESDSELCLLLCQKQLPPLPEDEKEVKWARIFKGACRTLLVNEYTSRQGGIRSMTIPGNIGNLKTEDHFDPVRGCLQAYARSTQTGIWVPMGIQYRKLLSCRHPRQRRSLTEGRKMSNSQSSLNSVDAQSAVDNAAERITITPVKADAATTPKPNNSPLRVLLKRSGFFGPVIESLVDMFDGGGWRELLNNFQLGSYVDQYQRLADDYAGEMDAGHCFFEYLTYNIFNHRFAQRAFRSSRRGIEDDASGFFMNAATGFLKSDNASQVLSSLFSMFTSPKLAMRKEESNSTTNQQSPPDVQEVAMSIARFYLRNYFSTLSGSKVRVDEGDPTNNPETLADMIEQVSRPVFLSIFGVVPGVPASGKLDHLLTMSSQNPELSENEIGLRPPEFRNKLVPIDPIRSSNSLLEPAITLSTGNSFFDFGNSVVATFQRASDATHGLYCIKQYAVNKMWDLFRGSMRRMMRAIPNVG